MKSYKEYFLEKLDITTSVKSKILNSPKTFCGLEFEFYFKEEYLPKYDVTKLASEYEEFININEDSLKLIFPKDLDKKIDLVFHDGRIFTHIEDIYDGYKLGMSSSFRDGLKKAGKFLTNPFKTGNDRLSFSPTSLPEHLVDKFPYKLIPIPHPGLARIYEWNITYDTTDTKLFEIVSPVLTVAEAVKAISLVNNYIQQYGYTKDTCGFHINVSFDKMDKIDLVKLVSLVDEQMIYDAFPMRKNNEYAASISDYYNNSNVYKQDIPKYIITFDEFRRLVAEYMPYGHYFAIDFTKIWNALPCIEFRYIGGAGYEKRTKELLDILTEFIYIFKASTNKSIKLQDISDKKLYDMYTSFVSNDPSLVRRILTKLHNIIR